MSRRLITVSQGNPVGAVATFSYLDSGLTGNTSTRTYTATGGSGSGAQFTVVRSGGGSNSPITSVTLFAGGSGYAVGNSLSINETVNPFDTITITVNSVTA